MKYRDHAEILPLLEGAGQSWAYVQDGDRDELRTTLAGGVLKCMLINGGQTKSNGDTVYLRCGSSKYHLLSPLPWAEYKAKRQIRQ